MFSAFTAGTKMRRYKSINSHPMRISTMSYEQLAMSYEQSAVSNNLKGKMQIVNKIIHKLSITICCLRYSLFPISYSLLPFAFCLLPFLVSAQSVISGKVFWDCNNNGVRDVGESGIKNITVRLLTTTNQQLSTLTDSVGNYSFNVSSGTYNVAVSMPIGSTKLKFSPRVVGADPTLNSDVDSSGMSDNLIVVSGTNYTSIDAGIVDQTAPKIQFTNPLISGLFSGDTLTVTCDNLPRMDASWVTVSDNSKQNLTAVFTDNLLVEGNCQANGFSKLLNCTWSATDYCGNIGAGYVLIKVIDTLAPVINNIPANVTVNTYLGDTVPNAPTNIYALDNCANNSVIPSIYNTVTAKTTCGSTITRTWSSTDGCGNTATKSQIIKVFDTQNCLVIYPNDTFKISLVASRSTDSCINGIFGTDRTVTSVSFTTPSISHNLVPSLTNGCLKITALQSFNQPDTLTGTTCDSSGNSCRNFYLIITPQSLRLNSCNLFNQDTVAFIKLATCSSKGYFCIPGVNDAIAFKNNYTISDNGAPYSGTLTGCQYDTTFSYTYITIPKLAKAGPYRLDYWLLNGQSYKIAAFRDIFVLVDSMNVWDKIGKWSVDTLTLTISGGKSVNTYGQIKITRLADGSVGYLEMNSELNANGVSVCFFAGTHEIIFKNNSTLCQDILRLVITCDTSVVSRKPHAINDNVSVKKNTLIIFDPTLNDSLFAAPIRTLTIINPPKNGSFAYSGNTSVVYVPTTGFCGNDTLKYAICNNYFLCDTANIFVSVSCATDSTPTQQKPIARADYTRSSKNVKVSIDFLSNDTPNGALTSTTIIKTPRRGVAVLNANKIDYTPNLNDCNYNDTLQYKICNAAGCDSTFVYVAVSCDTIPTGGSKKPVAVNDYITTTKNVTIRFKPTANDNINGILNSLSVFESPKHGSIGYIGLDSIIYKPNPDFCGRDTLRYQIGNTAFLSDSAYVFVNVTCGNDSTPTGKKPIAVNDNYNTPKSTALRFKPTANDIANGTIVSMGVTVQPKNGTVRALGIDSLMYTPNTNFCGLDSMKYNICNNFNLCDTAFIYINVACDTLPVSKKPVALADKATVKKNILAIIDVLVNDTLNGVVTTTINKAPRRGSATINNNKIDYIPQKDSCSYSDTLQYKICNAVGCDSANVIVSVTCDTTPLPQNPIARTDNTTTKKNTLVTVDVLANDTQNGALTKFTIIKQPKFGTVVSNNYKFDYTPQRDSCNYSDTLQYKICNAAGCDSAFVFIKVNCDSAPPAKKPITVNDNVTTNKNVTLRFRPTANDNINGTLASVSMVAGFEPKNGDVKYIGLDSLMYTPKKDFCGRDTFRYMVCNTGNLCDSAYVFVNVLCDSTKKPIAIADRATTKKNVLVTIDVQANDTLNGVATTTINKAPRRGTVVVNNNKIDYTPQKDSCNYSDTLQYKICNAIGCDSTNVIVSVTCPPDSTKKPVAVNDNAKTNKNKTVSIDILANDTPNGVLTVTNITRDPKKGKLVFNLTKIDYTPTKDSCGYIDTFQYKICNIIGCDTAFVFVSVSCDAPKTPKAVTDNATTSRNKTVIINVLANDTINGDLTTPVVITKNPKFGTINIVANAVVYTPSSGYCGVRDSFQYKICNAQGCDSTYSYVNITCDSTNLQPVANPDSVSTRKNTPIRIIILANDQINGTLDSIKITKSPILGTATLGTDNVLTYTPDSCGFIDSLRYRICNKTGCSETVVKINVICDPGVYKKPKATPDNATTYLNTPVTVDVTANDSLYGAPIDSVKVTTKPNHGRAIVANNKIIYTPDSCGYTDTLRYAVFTKGGSDTASLILSVICKRPDSLPPVAVYDVARGNKNTTLIIDVTANDTLRGADTFAVTAIPKNGTAQFDSLHRIKYVPNNNFCGRDTLIYQIANTKGSDTAIVFITIDCGKISRDSIPIANRDSATTLVNQPVTISVTANDSLRGATKVILIDTTTGVHGMPVVNADGKTITYTPFRNFFGVDTFRYVICNSYGCDTTTVYILINAGDSIIVYNGFSPNGDGMNDTFVIQGIDSYSDNEVYIFNRWGNEVYHTKGYSNSKGWDGKWNNVNVPDNTYFYFITINDATKGTIKKTGYVQIKR